MFGLTDCNNFYVSCERLFNPSLNGKPVVVLSNNDGCVISRSNEAKALGVKMGEPIFKMKEIVKREGIACFSANFSLYGDISARVMDKLRSFSPGIEIYSIDEAFLDFTGVPEKDIFQTGPEIVRRIKKDVGVPVSLGVSHTKTLAKVATRLSKKYPATKGFCLMEKPEDIAKVLSKFPVEDIWGIGRAYSKMLKSHGIETATDFTKKSPEWIKSRMGVPGVKSWRELRGEACIRLEDRTLDKKQICTSRSFAKDLYDFEDICKAVATFAAASAEKLRHQKGACREVLIFILTNPFKDNAKQHYQSAAVNLETHSDSTFTIAGAACNALRDIFREGYGYKKAGVILSEISRKSDLTLSLFEDSSKADKESSLMSVMDEINMRYGRHSLYTAAAGVEKIKSNQNMLSKRYTTSWDDIIEVKV